MVGDRRRSRFAWLVVRRLSGRSEEEALWRQVHGYVPKKTAMQAALRLITDHPNSAFAETALRHATRHLVRSDHDRHLAIRLVKSYLATARRPRKCREQVYCYFAELLHGAGEGKSALAALDRAGTADASSLRRKINRTSDSNHVSR
jgi:hypothetical protein